MNQEYSEILKQRIAANSQKKGHSAVIGGFQFTVFQNVYSPDPCTAGSNVQFYCSQVPKMGGTIIEVGTGCGVILLNSLLQGKFQRGIGLDIFQGAVQNAVFNAKKLNLQDKTQFHVSDVVSAIPVDQKADLLCWHYPFNTLPQGKKQEECNALEKAYFDPGLKGLRKFLIARRTHVKQNGKMLISMSPTNSPMKQITQLFQQLKLEAKQIARKEIGYSVIVVEVTQLK